VASFDWALQVDLNTALKQQERLTEIVDSKQLVVKTATLEEVTDQWPSSVLRQGQYLLPLRLLLHPHRPWPMHLQQLIVETRKKANTIAS
jgi:hypothetical protein